MPLSGTNIRYGKHLQKCVQRLVLLKLVKWQLILQKCYTANF